MEHVVWIGGPPCAGKTTVASRLARRHGLRLYSADTRTWDHLDRAIEAGLSPAIEWEAATPEERWQRSSPERMLERCFLAERGQMVIDDLAALPTSPLVVAEGVALPPSAVTTGAAPPELVLWMVPTAAFQDRQLEASSPHDGRRTLARVLRDVIRAEAARCGVTVLVVDGTLDLEATLALVERRFGEALARGPLAASAGARAALAREANMARVEQIRGYYARPWATGDPEAVTTSFWCECGDRACTEELGLRVGLVAAGPVLAPGH